MAWRGRGVTILRVFLVTASQKPVTSNLFYSTPCPTSNPTTQYHLHCRLGVIYFVLFTLLRGLPFLKCNHFLIENFFRRTAHTFFITSSSFFFNTQGQIIFFINLLNQLTLVILNESLFSFDRRFIFSVFSCSPSVLNKALHSFNFKSTSTLGRLVPCLSQPIPRSGTQTFVPSWGGEGLQPKLPPGT